MRVGQGSYGTVWKARSKMTSEVVAIKVIPLSQTEEAEFKQIQKEIRMLQGCNHPNVVRYLVSKLESCPYGCLCV